MTHQDHIALIQQAIGENEVWADFGSGEGSFTLALQDIAPKNHIFSIDKDEGRLKLQKRHFSTHFPHANITFLAKDFTKPLVLPPLDGILMANSLHFIAHQSSFLKNHVSSYLKPHGKLLIVEYNTTKGNMWVPYPIAWKNLSSLFEESGFIQSTFLHSVPSSFLDEIYAAYARRAY